MPAALRLQQDLDHHSPGSLKGHKPLLQRCRKKLPRCSYARDVKWSKAKADLRVTEGNRSCGEKKKSSLYMVIKHLQCSHAA